MEQKQPLVSIITPGWNGKEFIHRLLDSILAQTYKNIEYIYVDDGSTDGTRTIVESYHDKFAMAGIAFHYIYQENKGVAEAVNTGLQKVTGDYLCWVEYDDILTPDSIAEKLHYLQAHPDCAIVTSDAYIVSENDLKNPIGVLSKKNPNRHDRNHFVQALMSNSVFTAGCHMASMEKFDKTHPGRRIFPSRYGPNWQMLLPIYYKYTRGFIDRPLLYYVKRQESISNRKNDKGNWLKKLDAYRSILLHVLDEIDMPNDERLFYKEMVEKYQEREHMKVALRYRDKILFDKYYNRLKAHDELTCHDKFMEKASRNLLNWTFYHLLKRLWLALNPRYQ